MASQPESGTRSVECLSAAEAVSRGYHIIFANMQMNVIEADMALGEYNARYLAGGDEPVFIRDDSLVYLTKDSHGRSVLKPVTRGKLSCILTRDTMWYMDRGTRNGKDNLSSAAKIPCDMLESVLAAGKNTLESVPEIRNIQNGVLLDRNWKVIHEKGYNKSSRQYLTRNTEVEDIPDIVTDEMVQKEKAMLWDIFREFNFAGQMDGENSVDYQNTVAALLTAVLRPVWEGSLPIWVVSKSSERTGGSLLQEIVGILACGEEQPKYIFPKAAEEYEKGIDSFIVEGRRFGLIDNVVEGNTWVTVALLQQSTGTGRTILRVFGKKHLCEFYPETFFAVNGINIEMKSDVTGRVILTSIVPLKSWQDLQYSRTEQELRNLALEKHPAVIRAFSLFHRYWVQHGSPGPDKLNGNFDAFSLWCREVLAVLNCVGYHRILANLNNVQTEDNLAEEENLAMINALYDHYGLKILFTSGDLTTLLLDQAKWRRGRIDDTPETDDKILRTFPDEVIEKAIKNTLSPKSVGRALARILNRKMAESRVFLAHKRREYYFKLVDEQ